MSPDDELTHYGIPGMKWGRRKSRPGLTKGRVGPSGKFEKPVGPKKQVQKHVKGKTDLTKKPVEKMSDNELRNRINRMQMEEQYSRLSSQRNVLGRGMKYTTATVATVGTVTSVISAYNSPGGQAVRKAITASVNAARTARP